MSKSINEATLEEMKGLFEEEFSDVLATYLTDSETKVNQFPILLEQQAWQAINDHAHQLKSSSLNFGIEVLSVLAKQLEACAMTQNADEIEPLITDISAEYVRIKAYFAEHPQWLAK